MSNANDEHAPASAGHDRRAFLQRAGIGAAAVGAWVAPQVLFTSSASAGCTPITKLLQLNAAGCGSQTTTFNPNLGSCFPAGWASSRNDGVTFTCAPVFLGNTLYGAAITITSAGCGPTAGRAVKYCPRGSGANYTCVNGVVSGSTITFPALTLLEIFFGCVYVDFRITVTCCT